jgi:hypothetical protein
VSATSVARDRQARLIAVADQARARAVRQWQKVDFANLDASWAAISPSIAAEVQRAQLVMAAGADRFTSQMSTQYGFAQERTAIVPEAFVGVDGQGRALEGTLLGAVTTTKEAVGAGLARAQSMQAGASYLAVMMKTLVADMSRAADISSSTGRGYTHYVRVVGGSACSRCAILAGIASGSEAFARHVSCQCTAAPVVEMRAPRGLHDSPRAYFDSLSAEEQDRVFTKAGAEAIRSGADITKVVNARRGADGIGYSHAIGGGRQAGDPRGVFVKTTIGYRPNGDPVRVYTTTEGTTARGQFGKAQLRTSDIRRAAGARYTSTSRVRLMPESIMSIAGNDLPLRQAFLRDAGYIDYLPPLGTPVSGWTAAIEEQKRADRILVDRATAKFANFYLG